MTDKTNLLEEIGDLAASLDARDVALPPTVMVEKEKSYVPERFWRNKTLQSILDHFLKDDTFKQLISYVFRAESDGHYQDLVDFMAARSENISEEVLMNIRNAMQDIADISNPSFMEAFVAEDGMLVFPKNYPNAHFASRMEMTGLDGFVLKPVIAYGAVAEHDNIIDNTMMHELAHRYFRRRDSIHAAPFMALAKLDRDLNPDSIVPQWIAVRSERNYKNNLDFVVDKNEYVHARDKVESALGAYLPSDANHLQIPYYTNYDVTRPKEEQLFSEMFCIGHEYYYGDREVARRTASPMLQAYMDILIQLDADICRTLPYQEKIEAQGILNRELTRFHQDFFGGLPPTVESLAQKDTITEDDFKACLVDFEYIMPKRGNAFLSANSNDIEEQVICVSTHETPYSQIRRYLSEQHQEILDSATTEEEFIEGLGRLPNARREYCHHVEGDIIGRLLEIDRTVRAELGSITI